MCVISYQLSNHIKLARFLESSLVRNHNLFIQINYPKWYISVINSDFIKMTKVRG